MSFLFTMARLCVDHLPPQEMTSFSPGLCLVISCTSLFFRKTFTLQGMAPEGICLFELQTRSPSLGKWAGPGFEQTCLQALYFLQSPSAGVITLPGEKLFMAQYTPGDHKYLCPIAFLWLGQGWQEKNTQIRQLRTLVHIGGSPCSSARTEW